MNPVVKRLKDLRELMEQRGIDIYVVPTSDFHESEYVGEYFKARKFITGFTGSAGTAVITKTQAGLWTDGRYFVQAKNQLKDSTVTLFPMGEENVPTVAEFVKENLPPKGCIGFDGRVVNGKAGEEYKNIADEKKGRLYVEEDLVDLIWEERPPMSKKPFFILEEKYSGKSTKEKLQEVRGEMEKEKADIHILTSLYDISWLLNVRGGDVDYVPVVLSYLVLSKEECVWFLQQEILTEEQKSYLKDNGIVTKEYEEIYSCVPEIPGDKKALLHKSEVNYRIVNALKDTVEIIDKENPTELMKSVKNTTEAENTIKAHVKDGVAFTKFMYWLKNSIGKEEITEISASDVLENFRKQQENFLDLSFDTISAYGANAAMMHYSATEETNALLKPEGFLLVDSGGHYLEGTTDITRTMALGPITEEMRLHFTTVLCSNLNLASARFLHGCTGRNLDILSRGPLWKLGIDYKCGTGHGVGHILNVHEGPNSFRWQKREGVPEAVLEEGMITTDEPGVYIEGAYGIRTENELLCKKGVKNEYGQFMEFETITYAPIDLDAIDPNLMTEEQRAVLNEYHKKVYEVLSPYMTQEENKWLKEYTRAV